MLLPLVLGGLLVASCSSMKFERETEGAGTFRSSAISFTFLSKDFPQSAVLVARGNASDSGLPNLMVERETVFPYLPWGFDWILDIISFRYARVSGTWGHAPE